MILDGGVLRYDVGVMPKVLRILTRLNVGGPSIQAIRLTTDLAPFGYTTTLVHGQLAPEEGDMRELLAAKSADLRYVPALRRPISPLDDLKALAVVLRILRDVRPDIVHTHMAKAGLIGRLATVIYNRTFGRRKPARIVHTYHGHVLEGYFSSGATQLFIRLERALARCTDALIAISPRIRRELVERFRIAEDGRFRTIQLGFDLAPLLHIDEAQSTAARRSLDISPDAFVVTTVGRLTAVKNHALLIEAARGIAARHLNALVLIVGDGELRGQLEQRVVAAGLTSHVRFTGWRADLATIYGATDVFVLTSLNEGTPVALIEAMAAGVASVSTDVGGVPDVVAHGETGLLVPSGATEALVEAIDTLLRSPRLRREMGARARTAVSARYDIRRLLGDIDMLYRELMAREASAPRPEP